MDRSGRRAVLRATVPAAAAAIAGCAIPGSGDSSGEALRLDTIEVAGSPAGSLRVKPPDTVVLLDFWATWCAPCIPQMAELRSIHADFPDVHLLSITNEDDLPSIRSFWREHRGTWPVASDPSLRTNERFDVTRIPTLLVFDRSGRETWRHAGLAAAETIATALRDAGA